MLQALNEIMGVVGVITALTCPIWMALLMAPRQ